MLRINSNGTIPTDNPFFNTATGNNRSIWALGLRNPFTFAFQPGTGRMFVNDVGENTWEEINDAIAGGAFYNPVTVQFPQIFVGKYFFADLCSGWIRVFDPATGTASDFASGI